MRGTAIASDSFDVSNGTHEVTLMFADLYAGKTITSSVTPGMLVIEFTSAGANLATVDLIFIAPR
jgi:hypothetical protein